MEKVKAIVDSMNDAVARLDKEASRGATRERLISLNEAVELQVKALYGELAAMGREQAAA